MERQQQAGGPAPGTSAALASWEELVRAATELFRDVSAQTERQTGVGPSEYDVLLQLSRAPEGCLRTSQLRERVLLSQAALSRLLARLEGAGLVERTPDPEDARAHVVGLTPVGRKVWVRAGRVTAKAVEELFHGRVTDEEAAFLQDVLQRLRRR